MKKLPYTKLLVTLIFISIQTTLYAQWTKLNSGTSENLNAIAYFKPYDYIVYAVGNNGTILRSGDQGDSWLPLNSGTTKDLYSIFIDGKFGYISGSEGMTLWTVDGGAIWFQDTVSSNFDVLKLERTKHKLYAIANDQLGNNLFCKRSRGMAYWTCDSLFGLISIFNAPAPHDIKSLQFLNSDTGFIVGQMHDAVYKTVDSGSTWQSLSLIAPYSFFYDVYFVNNQLGFVAGKSDAGGLFYTNDGGNSWNLESLSVDRYFRSIDFTSNQIGAVVGAGTILLSTDQGNSWNIDTSTTNELLNDVLFYDNNLVFIVGDNGLILRDNNINGLTENKKFSYNLELYPNPFHHSATLNLAPGLSMMNLKLNIYNPLGQNVREIRQIINQKIEIKTGNLPKGLYFYQLKNDEQIIGTGKMIIE